LIIVIETANSKPKLTDKRALRGNLLSIIIPYTLFIVKLGFIVKCFTDFSR